MVLSPILEIWVANIGQIWTPTTRHAGFCSRNTCTNCANSLLTGKQRWVILTTPPPNQGRPELLPSKKTLEDVVSVKEYTLFPIQNRCWRATRNKYG